MSKERFVQIKNRALNAAAREGFKFLIPHAEIIAKNTKVEFAPNFFENYLIPISEGYEPVVVAKHGGWGEGITDAPLLDKLTTIGNRVKRTDNQRLNGFTMIIAASILSGHQGPVVEQGVRQTLPFLARHRVSVTELVRPEDIERYRMKPNLKEVLTSLTEAAKNGYGICLFAEGTVQGGRYNKYTERLFGMRPLKPVALELAGRAIERAGKKALYIPVASVGGQRLLNPDSKFLTPESIAAVARVGDPHLVDLFVDTPIRGDQVPKGVSLSNLIGTRIARRLPYEERGYYRWFTE